MAETPQSETNSRAFALRAAQWVGCSGAHKFEGKWMPCETHEELMRASSGAEPGRKSEPFIELQERYKKRKKKGKNKHWEKLRETGIVGITTLDDGGIVATPVSLKAMIPGLSPRDSDPDVFPEIESARRRSRMLGCIGVRRITSQSGRTVWMPCTNNTDYARVAGTTFLGRMRQREQQERAVRKLFERVTNRQRKKSIMRDIYGDDAIDAAMQNIDKKALGRSIRRAIMPNRASRRITRRINAVIEGVLDPRLRRDVDRDGFIFDGTWREMPDPTRDAAPTQALRSVTRGSINTGQRRGRQMGVGASSLGAVQQGSAQVRPPSKPTLVSIRNIKFKPGKDMWPTSALLGSAALRDKTDEELQIMLFGSQSKRSREILDAMKQPNAHIDGFLADRLAVSVLRTHPNLIWKDWGTSVEEEENPARRYSVSKMSKQNIERVKQIRQGLSEGKTRTEIAREMNISQQRVSQLLKQSARDESIEITTPRAIRSASRTRGQVRRDERGNIVGGEGRAALAKMDEERINKLREIGLSDEEINILLTGNKEGINRPESQTSAIDDAKLRRRKPKPEDTPMRSASRDQTQSRFLGLRSSSRDIMDMPESSRMHILDWARARPTFIRPYQLVEKYDREGGLQPGDWRKLKKFYDGFGPESGRQRFGMRSSSRTSEGTALANIGAERMKQIILDRVRKESSGKPDGTKTHYMIAGLAGQGKTTLLEHLVSTGQIPDSSKAAHADSDFIKKGLRGYEAGLGTTAVHRESTRAQADVINTARDRGMDIVSEGIGIRWGEYKTTSDKGYKKVMHIAYTPLDISTERVKKRNEKPGERKIPISLVTEKADWLYDTVLRHLDRGLGEVYIWDTDVPEGAAPRVIAKVVDGEFTVFDKTKFKKWSEEMGGKRGGDSNLKYWENRFKKQDSGYSPAF